jgi:hypothetical protein
MSHPVCPFASVDTVPCAILNGLPSTGDDHSCVGCQRRPRELLRDLPPGIAARIRPSDQHRDRSPDRALAFLRGALPQEPP